MRPERRYVYWVKRPNGIGWKAYYRGLEAHIKHTPHGYDVINHYGQSIRDRLFPNLNMAKRAGSKWLKGQMSLELARAK